MMINIRTYNEKSMIDAIVDHANASFVDDMFFVAVIKNVNVLDSTGSWMMMFVVLYKEFMMTYLI